MGLALAKEAYIRGADLTLVVAKVSVDIPSVFNVVRVETGNEMNEAILNLIPDFDIFISTAAVSDFTPINKENSKLSSSYNLSLEFEPVAKIIQRIKKINEDIFLVGFKAEYNIPEEKMIDCAKTQMRESGTDLVVANDVSHDGCGFGSETNEVILVSDEVKKVSLNSKKEISKSIFDEISKKLD